MCTPHAFPLLPARPPATRLSRWLLLRRFYVFLVAPVNFRECPEIPDTHNGSERHRICEHFFLSPSGGICVRKITSRNWLIFHFHEPLNKNPTASRRVALFALYNALALRAHKLALSELTHSASVLPRRAHFSSLLSPAGTQIIPVWDASWLSACTLCRCWRCTHACKRPKAEGKSL
jgi:hypothetical protein